MNAPHFGKPHARHSIAAAYPVAAAVKCVVCFGLVALLAIMANAVRGDSTIAPAAPAARTAGAQAMATGAGDRAAAHRRQVFDERRARFEGSPPADGAIARAAPDGEAQAPGIARGP